MPIERLTLSYRRLFELRVMHHYWLDDGATMFDHLPAAAQLECLRRYDVRALLDIRPTDETAALLEDLGAVWRTTSLGGLVALPGGAGVDDTSVFDFTMRRVDPGLESYTAYGLVVPGSDQAWDGSTRRVLRFRTNAALYTNLTGCARGAGSAKQLFLSREAPAGQGTDRVESLVNDNGALVQLLGDSPGAAKVEIGPAVEDLPGFATHADIPAIGPFPGVEGTLPPQGILLPEKAPSDTYALIRIVAVRTDDVDFSCTAGGVAKPIPPVFQLRFKNRRTLWRRVSHTSPETVLSEDGPHPLTYSGNPSASRKPATRVVKLDRAGSVITNIVSEVFM